MGTYSNGANGNFSGKVGSMIGSSWRKVNYIRGLSKPSKKAPSTKQMAQRTKFAMGVDFLKPIKDVLNVGMMDKKQGSLSGYNLAVKKLLSNAIIGEYPDFQIDYPSVQFSSGSLNGLFVPKMEAVEANLNVTWKSLVNKYNAFIDDEVVIIMFNVAKNTYFLFDETTRETEGYLVELGADFSGDVIHCWIFVCERNQKAVSPTQYVGEVTLP